MRGKEKALSIGVGVILLGSMVSSTAICELRTPPEQEVEIAEAQAFNSKALHDQVARPGVVLTIDILQMVLGSASSANDIDVVTAPSMRYR